MTYADYIQQGGTGIFKLLSDNQALTFLLSDDITTLDTAFLFENGAKNFSLATETILSAKNDLTPLANMIKVRFGEKWKILYNTIPKSSQTIAGEVTTTSGSVDSNNQNTNQVSGYDSDNMVNDTANTSTTNHKTAQTETKTDYLKLTDLLTELTNNVFYDMIFTDVRSYIFVTIYGNERTL